MCCSKGKNALQKCRFCDYCAFEPNDPIRDARHPLQNIRLVWQPNLIWSRMTSLVVPVVPRWAASQDPSSVNTKLGLASFGFLMNRARAPYRRSTLGRNFRLYRNTPLAGRNLVYLPGPVQLPFSTCARGGEGQHCCSSFGGLYLLNRVT